MRKLLIASAILGALLILAAAPDEKATGFSCGYPCGNPFDWEFVHQWITDEGLNFLRSGVLSDIKDGNTTADQLYSRTNKNHFGYCLFSDAGAYINEEFVNWIIPALAAERPELWPAADHFGLALHAAQDFYAHSNWSEIWESRLPGESVPFIYEDGFGEWRVPGDWAELRYQDRLPYDPSILIGQTHSGALPGPEAGWTPWTVISDRLSGTGHVPTLARTNNVDGSQDQVDVLITFGLTSNCYQPIGLEHNDEFTLQYDRFMDPEECLARGLRWQEPSWYGPGGCVVEGLNKDRPREPYYAQAYDYAVAQTRHEWCRLLNLAKDRLGGFAGTSAALGLMVSPGASPPNCSKVATREALIRATVQLTNVSTEASFPELTFVVYTGDLRQAVTALAPEGATSSLSICLNPSDTLVMTVQGRDWVSYPIDLTLAGRTLTFAGPEFGEGSHPVSSGDIDATFNVTIDENGPPCAPIVVNSTADPGDGNCGQQECTLHEAIDLANALPGYNSIHFAIGSGPRTIRPSVLLPTVSEPVTIDGRTQPGWQPGMGPIIEIDGGLAPLGGGLNIQGGGSTVRGLAINRFKTYGMILHGGANTIQGNYIGTNLSGDSARGNARAGIYITGPNNAIGSTLAGDGNVISGNSEAGIETSIVGLSGGNIIRGNYIGVDRTGTIALGNGQAGIALGSFGNDVRWNTISFNGFDGISVALSAGSNRMSQNGVSNNGGLGIDLQPDGFTQNDAAPDADTGANQRQNFPVLTSARTGHTTTSVQGELISAPERVYSVHYYGNDECDPSGYGEGRELLGGSTVTTDWSGRVALTEILIASAPFITATATDEATGNTSEFSNCIEAPIYVNSTADPGDGTCNATQCTLREAIELANALAGHNKVYFEIGSGPQTIRPTALLPPAYQPVTIDGSTQPGWTAGTGPIIEIDGTLAPPGSGLDIRGGDSVIRGLVINRFDADGIDLQVNGGNTVAGNYIGTDMTGRLVRGNGYSGVYIGTGSGNNTIGSAAQGATFPGDRNVISGNGHQGIVVWGPGENTIEGNRIGTDQSTVLALGNGQAGIELRSPDNSVRANIIEHNQLDGIYVTTSGNNVGDNYFLANGGLGIDLAPNGVTPNDPAPDLDTGANGLLNYPVLTSGGASGGITTVYGTFTSAPNKAYSLRLYDPVSCDPSGYGEGAFLRANFNVTTDAGGHASFSQAISASASFLTATALDPATGDTSEFSECLYLSAIVVNSTADPGNGVCNAAECTLREAMNLANSLAGDNLIEFAIGTGPQTIRPTALLPALTGPTVVDGRTQPGFTGAPLIEIDGKFAPAGSGLDIRGGGSAVYGLVLNRFGTNGIVLQQNGGNTVRGNYIGTNLAGDADLGNGYSGIYITNDSPDNIIGGTSPGDGNVISGNGGDGIRVWGTGATGGNVIQGNYIGTDRTGMLDIGNDASGIRLAESGDIVGVVGGANVISGNDTGVQIHASGAGNVIDVNYIGLAADGTTPLGNTAAGIVLNGSDNIVLYTRIANNGAQGVQVGDAAQGNSLRSMRVHSNGALGIDLLPATGVTPNDAAPDADTGANGLQNYPVLTSALADPTGPMGTVSGTLTSAPGTQYQVQFYFSDSCDASGHGEGTLPGISVIVSTDAQGEASFAISVYAPLGKVITTTARNILTHDTSEFSNCVSVERDADADGIGDSADNCPGNPNVDQANNDGDGRGDACDSDDDNDGVLDVTDNCRHVANADQMNTDGDPEGDACDSDDDNDGVNDTLDNCPSLANLDQTNTDGDTLGDACDNDDDNDSVFDGLDNCPLVGNKDQTDTDADGEGDACDIDDDNDSFGLLQSGLPLFSDSKETFLGTDPLRACATTPDLNDERGADAWPFDFNDDQRAGVPDVLAFIPVFGSTVPNPAYNRRFDFNADFRISMNDILLFIPVINSSCAR